VREEERERGGLPEGADVLPLPGGAQRLAAVLQQGQGVLLDDGRQPVHVAGVAQDVDGEDGAGAQRDLPLEVVQIHLEGGRVDVHQAHLVAGQHARPHLGRPRHGGYENLVQAGVRRAEAEGAQQVGAAAAVDHDGVLGAHPLGEGRLEGGDAGAHRRPALLEGGVDGGHLFLAVGDVGQRVAGRHWLSGLANAMTASCQTMSRSLLGQRSSVLRMASKSPL
jgi:hypothetical protein